MIISNTYFKDETVVKTSFEANLATITTYLGGNQQQTFTINCTDKEYYDSIELLNSSKKVNNESSKKNSFETIL